MTLLERLEPVMRRLLCALSAVALPIVCFAQAGAQELWVIEEGSLEIAVIDTGTDTIIGTIDISDPDADGSPDAPWGITFSTAPGGAGDRVFVTQQGLLTILDAGSKSVVDVLDLADLLGEPGMVLRGCAASPPRRFLDPVSGAVVVALLDVAATLADGSAAYIVLDQQKVLAGNGAGAVVGWGPLGVDGRGVSVSSVHGLPTGSRRHEPIYTTVHSGTAVDTLTLIRVSTGEILDGSFDLELIVDKTLPFGQGPRFLEPGAPVGRRLPVAPLGSSGQLENTDTGGQCSLGGDQIAVSVAGPGPNSYSVFSLDRSSDELLLIDPTDCSQQNFSAGPGVSSLVTLGQVEWRAVYVSNRDGDSLTRLGSDGTLQQIPLALPGPGCSKCPTSMAMTPLQFCSVSEVALEVSDLDLDGSQDDILLSWDAPGCPDRAEFAVFCQCTTAEPDCPCACDCNAPAPGCICPGLNGLLASLWWGDDPPAEQALHLPPWDIPILKNPWKKLGNSIDGSYEHNDAANGAGDWAYGVSQGEEPPP